MKKKSIRLVDVVNLNADASCLSSAWWLKILSGGKNSYFCQWLNVYIKLQKKVSLGLTGATVADIAIHNPEAIQLINANRKIFEIVLRPFSHDIALFRSADGFQLNLECGIKTLKKEFKSYVNFFLPPEFMLTNEQVMLLSKAGVEGTFINPSRFNAEIQQRLPELPYILKGLLESEIKTIPFSGAVTSGYLQGIHHFNAVQWNQALKKINHDFVFTWRDGESSFFVSNGNEREKAWLSDEDKNIERCFLSECIVKISFENNAQLKEKHYHHYPIHSFNAWIKESRTMGFVQKLQHLEGLVYCFSKQQKQIWLQVINSDIMSAVEKNSPVIDIKEKESSSKTTKHTIWRSERGMEGEEYFWLLEQSMLKKAQRKYILSSQQDHIVKLQSRMKYLEKIL